MNEKGISTRDLLEKTLAHLAENNGAIEQILPEEVLSEIAYDSNGDRIWVGYMVYKSVVFFEKQKRKWVLSLGLCNGQFPAENYNCDIVAVRVPKNGQFLEALKGGRYFSNSLVFSTNDGRLAMEENLKKRVQSRINEFIVSYPNIDYDCVTASGAPHIIKPLIFDESFVPFFSQMIQKVL